MEGRPERAHLQAGPRSHKPPSRLPSPTPFVFLRSTTEAIYSLYCSLQPPPPPHPTWAILVSHTYHHTTACANLYCVKRTLVSRLSTGVYVCEYTLDHLRNLAYQTAACLNSFKYHNTRKLC